MKRLSKLPLSTLHQYNHNALLLLYTTRQQSLANVLYLPTSINQQKNAYHAVRIKFTTPRKNYANVWLDYSLSMDFVTFVVKMHSLMVKNVSVFLAIWEMVKFVESILSL
jgi:hypothetical protein